MKERMLEERQRDAREAARGWRVRDTDFQRQKQNVRCWRRETWGVAKWERPWESSDWERHPGSERDMLREIKTICQPYERHGEDPGQLLPRDGARIRRYNKVTARTSRTGSDPVQGPLVVVVTEGKKKWSFTPSFVLPGTSPGAPQEGLWFLRQPLL